MPASRLIRTPGLGSYTICTSSTRPANPVAGSAIWETDTNRFLIYTTATTGWVQPWNMPWGVLAYAVDSTARNSSINSGAGLVVFPTLSFTPVTNRIYRITWHSSRVQYVSAAGATCIVQLCNQAGTVQQNLEVNLSGGASSERDSNAVMYATFATGSLTGIQVLATGSAPTANVFQFASYGAYLAVEDCGPSGAPV